MSSSENEEVNASAGGDSESSPTVVDSGSLPTAGDDSTVIPVTGAASDTVKLSQPGGGKSEVEELR